MGIQQKQLDELRLWLTQTEDRISRLSQSAKMDVDSLRSQLEEHSALRADLRKQQLSVDSLSNLVVVIDENSYPDSGDHLLVVTNKVISSITYKKKHMVFMGGFWDILLLCALL